MAKLKVPKQSNRKGPIEAKGRGAKRTGYSIPSEVEPESKQVIPKIPKALTSHDIFLLCIKRARNLLKIHQAAHGKKSKPEAYLADAHRAAIVLAVSALDAFIRTFVIAKIREVLADKSATISESLSEKIKNYLKGDGLLQAARKDDLLDRVEKAFQKDFDKKSFQGVNSITSSMKMVGYKDIFHDVAIKAKLNEDNLRNDLDKFTERRHIIAHKGDYDLNENPPKENTATKKNAEDCIRLVTLIAKHINELRL